MLTILLSVDTFQHDTAVPIGPGGAGGGSMDDESRMIKQIKTKNKKKHPSKRELTPRQNAIPFLSVLHFRKEKKWTTARKKHKT